MTDMIFRDATSKDIPFLELSVSSFLVLETKGQVVAAVSAWIEGSEGISSSILKGNLLSYTLPKFCIERATSLNPIINDLHIEYAPNSIQLGNGHVLKDFRGNNLLRILMDKKIELLSKIKTDISEAYAQIYACNTPSIRTCERMNFEKILLKESLNKETIKYLPYDKKILMKKELLNKNQ
jgi:hypothetical protein